MRIYREDISDRASWMAAALRSCGYLADFSIESLAEVERFFTEHAPEGRARIDGHLASDPDPRLVSLGYYVGEVLRLHAGGEWESDEEGVTARNPAMRLRTGVVWPVERARERFRDASICLSNYGEPLDLGVNA